MHDQSKFLEGFPQSPITTDVTLSFFTHGDSIEKAKSICENERDASIIAALLDEHDAQNNPDAEKAISMMASLLNSLRKKGQVPAESDTVTQNVKKKTRR